MLASFDFGYWTAMFLFYFMLSLWIIRILLRFFVTPGHAEKQQRTRSLLSKVQTEATAKALQNMMRRPSTTETASNLLHTLDPIDVRDVDYRPLEFPPNNTVTSLINATMRTCPACGNMVTRQGNYCPKCGCALTMSR